MPYGADAIQGGDTTSAGTTAYVPTIDVGSHLDPNAPIGEPGSEWSKINVGNGAPGGRLSPDYLIKRLKDQGYSEAGAQGIVNRFVIESGLNPSASGDKGTSLGLAQWHDSRKADLIRFAKDRGESVDDPDLQLAFLDHEMTTQYPKLRKQLMAATDPQQAQDAFTRVFERPASVMTAGASGQPPVTGNDRYQVASSAVGDHLGSPDTSVVHMTPADYLALSPPIAETGNDRKMALLAKSLDAGEPIAAIPTLDVNHEGTSGTVTGQDGRNRALMAQQRGIDLIPVALKGAPTVPTELQGMTGTILPIDPSGQVLPPTVASQAASMAPAEAAALRRQPGSLLDMVIPPAEAAYGTDMLRASQAAQAGAVAPSVGGWGQDPLMGAGATPAAPQAPAQAVSGATPAVAGPLQRFATGLMDPIEGGAQLLSHLVPAPIERGINNANNWLARNTGLVAPLPPGGMDQYELQREAAIQAARGGATGIDPLRIAGNIANPINYLPFAAGVRAAGVGGRLLASAAGGGLASLMNPITSGDYWWAQGQNALAGAAVGGALGAAGEGVAHAIAPHFRDPADLLLHEGVSLTPGQAAGGVAKRSEDAARSIPLVGSAIQAGQRRSIVTFDRAAINRALAPIGQKLPKGLDAGHEAIDYAAKRLGDAYDALLPKLKAELDPEFKSELLGVAHLGANLPPQQRAQLQSVIRNEIVSRFTPAGGLASGFTAKEIESKLGQISSGMSRSADYDVMRLGGAVKELQASVRRMVERVNPQESGALQAINHGWANLLRVQRAAASVGAQDGVFTPTQLVNAVKALDTSKNKAAFARGHALMQDLADAGKAVLPSTVPDSGTPERLLWAGLAGGSAFNPALAAPAIAAASAYTQPGMNLLRQFATFAPKTRNMLAQAPRYGGMASAPAAAIAMRPAPVPVTNPASVHP